MSPSDVSEIIEMVRRFASDPARLMDIALAVQRRFGYVSDQAIDAIATGVGRHPAEIRQMVSFYAFFDREPRGRCRIRLSRTPISLMKGAGEVASAFADALGIAVGEISADGAFSLDWTSDLGMADQEPAALIDMRMFTDLTPAAVPSILEALRLQGTLASSTADADHVRPTLPNESVRSSVVKRGHCVSLPTK